MKRMIKTMTGLSKILYDNKQKNPKWNTSQKYTWSKQADYRWQAPLVTDYWDKLLDEIVEKILIGSIKSSDHMCKIYNNVINTWASF